MTATTIPSTSRFPRPRLATKSALESAVAVKRFELPEAPAAFRAIVWEAEYTARGLKRLSLLTRSDGRIATDTTQHSGIDTSKLKALQSALLDRLTGGRDDLDWGEFDLEGTGDFHRRVWKAMRDIPFGETATYAEVARNADSPLAFRACGQACGKNPILIFIPCHRVVASTGLGGFGYGLEWKKHFLAMEKQKNRAR